MTELKPCPAECLHTIDRGPPSLFQRRSDIWGVYCPSCQCSTEYYGSEAEAIAVWNTRAVIRAAGDDGELVERLRYTYEHGIFVAAENGMLAGADEAADRLGYNLEIVEKEPSQ